MLIINYRFPKTAETRQTGLIILPRKKAKFLAYFLRRKPNFLSLTLSSLTLSFVFYVYLLKSLKDKRLYIGFYPNDLRTRILKPHPGLITSTKHRRPLELFYYEAYKSKKDAMIRERQLKRFAKDMLR